MTDISYEQFAEKHHIANYVVLNKESDAINRCIYVKKQERLYHMFKVVSSIINEVAIECDIAIAFVKGIFLEKKFYGANFLRKVSDVDLIIAWDDICKLLLGCQKYGLFCNYTEEHIRAICSSKQLHGHHIDLQTEYVCGGTIFSFEVEFHFRFFDQYIHENYDSHEELIALVLENRDYIRIDGYKFPILSLENDILFVMAHTVKHLIWDFHRSQSSTVNYYMSLSNFYDVHLMFESCNAQNIIEDVIHRAKNWNLYEELLLCMYIENVFFNGQAFKIDCLDESASFINPRNRWIAFFAYYIIKKKLSSVLLGPISCIGKTLLSLANTDNKLDVYMNHGFVDINIDHVQLQIGYSSNQSIIISSNSCGWSKMEITMLKRADKMGMYKTYNIDINDENESLTGEIVKEVKDDRITFELTSSAIEECVYDQKFYLRVLIEDDGVEIPMHYKEQAKFTFFCVELKNDEKNI